MLIPKRPEDKHALKYWLPYGYMRRRLARSYGMSVRNGRLVSGNVTASDTSGFSLWDLLPLWMVMRMQPHATSPATANRDDKAAEIRRLRATLAAERTDFRHSRECLEVENLRIKARLKEIERMAGASKVSEPIQDSRVKEDKPFVIDFSGSLYRKPIAAAWNGWRLMDANPLSVNMICSIGGDCIAASQQRNRGLRPYSLPFDWCFSDGASAIERFAEQLEKGFSGFALKQNMQPIPGLRFGYKDIATGYNFMHHFQAAIDAPGEYDRFRAVLDRRMKRFFDEMERAESVLFLLSRTFKLDVRCLLKVRDVCLRKWPQKTFYFILVTYNSQPSSISKVDGVIVIRIPRDRNAYDIKEKVFEWSFLDNVKLMK